MADEKDAEQPEQKQPAKDPLEKPVVGIFKGQTGKATIKAPDKEK